MSRQRGMHAEQIVQQYLIEKGLNSVTHNFHCRMGEIDLIMRDKEYLVFIEVKMRASHAFGGAIASVTANKRQKLLNTAQYYLQKNNLYEKLPIRFDVICLQGNPPQVNWIKNAFGN